MTDEPVVRLDDLELLTVTWDSGTFPGGLPTVQHVTWGEADGWDTSLLDVIERVSVKRVTVSYDDGRVVTYERHPIREA